MKQKLLLFVASMMMSVAAMAQWTKPVPQHIDIVYGDTVYLYNVGTSSFFLGANAYGTRASVDPSHGYKCVLAEAEGYVTISIISCWLRMVKSSSASPLSSWD